MATSTRMRVSNSVQVYHRIAAADDMGQHDVGTNDAKASGLGGSGDFELEADTNVTYNDSLHAVFDNTAAGTALGANTINDFIYIKHTGYTTATKATATVNNLQIGLMARDANAGNISLEAGESICLHGLGSESNNTNDFKLRSGAINSDDVYVEIVFL